MGGSTNEVGKVLGLLVEDYLATDDLLLDFLGQVLQHGLVDLRGTGLKEEVLVLEDGRPVRHVLVFFGPEQPNLTEPSQFSVLRRLVNVSFLGYE